MGLSWNILKEFVSDGAVKIVNDFLYAVSKHKHDDLYLGITAKAADSDKLNGVAASGYSLSAHGHSDLVKGAINMLIQTGWGYVAGDGSNSFITKAETFPIAFDANTVPRVFCNFQGVKATSGGVPANENDCSNGADYARALSVTNTGFTADVHYRDNTALVTTTNYVYTWMAIGIKAR
jgi:hypothetical protein